MLKCDLISNDGENLRYYKIKIAMEEVTKSHSHPGLIHKPAFFGYTIILAPDFAKFGADQFVIRIFFSG